MPDEEDPMTTASIGVPQRSSPSSHPLRTIRDIRDSLPEDQRAHFDVQLADTKIEDLPKLLHRWVTLGNDGFEEFLLSRPFEGLEFGARSYDSEPDDTK